MAGRLGRGASVEAATSRSREAMRDEYSDPARRESASEGSALAAEEEDPTSMVEGCCREVVVKVSVAVVVTVVVAVAVDDIAGRWLSPASRRVGELSKPDWGRWRRVRGCKRKEASKSSEILIF
jgi:hypothetical protein